VAIENLLNPDLTFILNDLESRDALFERMAAAVHRRIPDLDPAALVKRLQEREEQGPTSVPEGVAFPHALTPEITQTLVLVCLLRPGVDFGVAAHPESDIIFGIFGPVTEPWSHVRLLARLARIARAESARQRIRAAAEEQAVFELLVQEDRQHG